MISDHPSIASHVSSIDFLGNDATRLKWKAPSGSQCNSVDLCWALRGDLALASHLTCDPDSIRRLMWVFQRVLRSSFPPPPPPQKPTLPNSNFMETITDEEPPSGYYYYYYRSYLTALVYYYYYYARQLVY